MVNGSTDISERIFHRVAIASIRYFGPIKLVQEVEARARPRHGKAGVILMSLQLVEDRNGGVKRSLRYLFPGCPILHDESNLFPFCFAEVVSIGTAHPHHQ